MLDLKLDEVLKMNPKIDMKVLAEFEQAKRTLNDLGLTQKGSSYSLQEASDRKPLVQLPFLNLIAQVKL